jgi:Ca2+-binding EF-hand superfamily protein
MIYLSEKLWFLFSYIYNYDVCKISHFIYFSKGLTPDEIHIWHGRFFRNNPDGRLDRLEFRKLFYLLRQESPERLDDICGHVFRAFDVDGNGYVEFGEFLLGFAICSRGDLRSRLDYAFECYDLDSNGYITEGKN